MAKNLSLYILQHIMEHLKVDMV